MYQFAAPLQFPYQDNHSPEYNGQLPAYSAPGKHHPSSLSSRHTKVCSTLCMDWAKHRGSLQDSLLALVDEAGWSAANRCLSMRVGLRMFAHLWRACCPIPRVRLKARRELLLVSEALQDDDDGFCLPFWCTSRAADWSESIKRSADDFVRCLVEVDFDCYGNFQEFWERSMTCQKHHTGYRLWRVIDR